MITEIVPYLFRNMQKKKDGREVKQCLKRATERIDVTVAGKSICLSRRGQTVQRNVPIILM